jgi:hypothetical protein
VLLEKTVQTHSVYYIRALTIRLENAVIGNDFDVAKDVFYNRLRPLVTQGEFDGSESALLCFSCMGEAFLNENDVKSAIDILGDGIAASKRRISPDLVALAALYHNLAAAYAENGYEDLGHKTEQLALETALKAYPDGMHPDFAWIFVETGLNAQKENDQIHYGTVAMKIITTFWDGHEQEYGDVLKQCVEIDAPQAKLTFGNGGFSVGSPTGQARGERDRNRRW